MLQVRTYVSNKFYIKVLQFTCRERMSSSKSRKRFPQLGELLEIPFRHKRSRSSSPNPTSASSSTTPISTFSNVTSGSPTRAGGSVNSGISSSRNLPGTAQATGYQLPNPQSLTISIPVKNVAFHKAIQQCVDNLSDDDKEAFQSAKNVMERLGELQQRKPRTSSSHITHMQRVQKVLHCLKRFLESTAICIQHHPEISSLVVGGLNCILMVSTCPIDFLITNVNSFLLG